jgi:hypothetical protein
MGGHFLRSEILTQTNAEFESKCVIVKVTVDPPVI